MTARAFSHVRLGCLTPGEVAMRMRELTADLPARFAPPRLLCQTRKSMVCLSHCLESGRPAVIKRYFDPSAYGAETSGYLLFRGGPIAEVMLRDDPARLIVLEKLPGRQPSPTREDLMRVVSAYAVMHDKALENLLQAWGGPWRPTCDDPCLDALALADHPARQAISVGDGKPEHLLFDEGTVRIVDLETHSLHRSVWFDILSLGRFWPDTAVFVALLPELVAHYCSERRLPAHFYDLEKIERCLGVMLQDCPRQPWRQEARP